MSNYGAILEGLKRQRNINECELDWSDDLACSIVGENAEFSLLPHEERYYERGLNESEFINEASIVTFGGRTFPKQGWAVVMSGGAGLLFI